MLNVLLLYFKPLVLGFIYLLLMTRVLGCFGNFVSTPTPIYLALGPPVVGVENYLNGRASEDQDAQFSNFFYNRYHLPFAIYI